MKGYLFGLGAMILGSVVFWFLVFGFFMLRTIFLILSPKNEVYLDNHHNYGCDGSY